METGNEAPQDPSTRSWLLEALLTLCAAWAVHVLALPLAALHLPQVIIAPRPVWAPRQDSMYELAAFMLPELMLVGWLALAASRLGGPPSTPVAATLAVWCVWLGLRNSAWSSGAVNALPTSVMAAGLVALVAVAVIGAWLSICRKATTLHQPRAPRSAFVYPGFIFFCGVGTIWLLDFFAEAYPLYWRWGYPARHIACVGIAICVLTVVAAGAPLLLVSLSRLATLAETHVRTRGAWLARATLALFAMSWLGGVFAFVATRKSAGLPAPATAAELLRVPLWFALAWFGYRWGDQVPRAGRVALPTLAVTALCFALLAVIGEAGQILLNLGVLTLYASGLILCWRVREGWRRTAAVLATCAALLVGLAWALATLGSAFGPDRVALRIAATADPFHAHDPYLAQLRRFGAEAGLTGFGIGAAPWCGYMGAVLDECRAGVPLQTPSDYSYFGLVGVWGLLGACGIVFAFVLWLLNVALAAQPRTVHEAQAVSPQLLAAWLTGIFATAMLAQAFLTIFGALGAFPLTGVTLPLLALGGSGMGVTALFVAFAVSPVTMPGPFNRFSSFAAERNI